MFDLAVSEPFAESAPAAEAPVEPKKRGGKRDETWAEVARLGYEVARVAGSLERLVAKLREKSKPKKKARYFAAKGLPPVEEAAGIVRGVLLRRMDDAYERGELGTLLWRDSPDDAVKSRGLLLFQAICAALFIEEFVPDAALATRVEAALKGDRKGAGLGKPRSQHGARPTALGKAKRAGLIPNGGVERAGAARMVVFAKVLAAGRKPTPEKRDAGA